MPKPTKLWALFIAINDYPSSPLSGCIPDAEALKNYLLEDGRFDLEGSLLTLYDKAATKSAIANAILNHLGQAKAGEAALLYFSGHGAQERADTRVWTEERDGCLEALACYSPPGAPFALLADKELRFLLNRAVFGGPDQPKSGTPPHLLAIFDCCHSGDSLRSVGLQAETARERRFTNIFPQRPWKDFLFANEFAPEQLAGPGLGEHLPSAPLVQLAAAKDDQAALEIGGRGVFTSYLVQALQQSRGALDYTTLHQLVSNYIRFKHQQNPQFTTLGAGMDLLYRGFLGQEVDPEGKRYGRANYSTAKGWLLNMGQMHGLSEDTEAKLLVGNEQAIDCRVGETMDVSSTLDIDFEQRRELDKKKSYAVEVAAMQSYPVHVYINDRIGEAALVKRLKASLKGLPEPVLLTDTEENADYVIHLYGGLAYVTEGLEAFRPFSGRVYPLETATEEELLRDLIGEVQMVAQWAFTYHLHNTKLKILNQPPLAAEVYQQTEHGWERVMAKGEDFTINVVREDAQSGKLQAKVKVRLTNTFDRKLYFCLLVLSDQRRSVLSVDRPHAPGLVEQAITPLEPGDSITLFGHRNGGVIPYTVGELEQFQNRPFSQGWFKLIVSTKTEIAYDHLLVPRLKMLPDLEGPPVDDWTTQRIGLRIVNPNYNTVSQADLKRWLEDDEKAPLATGLYLDTNGLSSTPVLKPSMQLRTPDQQLTRSRNLFWDALLGTANSWASFQRNRDFKRRLRKHYERPLMVSEGDSWFQHPTIMEIIDHLSLDYNIYSRGAAGDEMRNYMMTGDYLNAFTDLQAMVEEVAAAIGKAPKAPAFFLISGGGNDILGDQFKDFLVPFKDVEERAPGEAPERFLNPRFQEELDAIMALYEHVFRRLATVHPDVRILAHGYDYPIPKGVADKGMSWLGKPMTLQGIQEKEDREAVVRYMIDTFNDRLQAVAEAFGQATHVDLRNTVKPYQWADEIHPNQEGYQNIALQFSKVIDSHLAGNQ